MTSLPVICGLGPSQSKGDAYGGGYLRLDNYQLPLSILLPLAPLIIFLYTKHRQNKLFQ